MWVVRLRDVSGEVGGSEWGMRALYVPSHI